MKKFKKYLLLLVITTVIPTLTNVKASSEDVRIPPLAPPAALPSLTTTARSGIAPSSTEGMDATPDDDPHAPITPAYGYNTLPPLSCEVLTLGTLQPEGTHAIDASIFAGPIGIPTQVIGQYVNTVITHINTTRANICSPNIPWTVGWSTNLIDDLDSRTSARCFKPILKHFQDKLRPLTPGTEDAPPETPIVPSWRGSTHGYTRFHTLQNELYKLMNHDGAARLSTPEADKSLEPVAISRVKRLFGRKTSKTMERAHSTDCLRPISPKEKLLTFIELLKQLETRGYYIFKKSVIHSITTMFDRPDLIVTSVRALLITEGSEVPAISGDMLKPGDLAIMIETLSDEKTNARGYHILRIRSNVSLKAYPGIPQNLAATE